MFVNAHTHLYSGLAPLGMPQPAVAPAGFVDILEGVWWRLDRALDAASLRAAARYYVSAARRAGTAVLVDHHESPAFIDGSLDILGDACAEFGVAAVLCYGATERNGGRDEARRGLAECRRFIESNRRPMVAGVVGLHATFTVSDETIREAGELCRELRTVLHVHLAEDVADVQHARRLGYEGPLERLISLDALPAGSILAHGVHLSAEQVWTAAEAGCWLVQNPRSNEHNGVGYPRALRDSRRVALGTDGFDSDMRAEAAALDRISAHEGEAAGVAVARLEAGWRLAEERLGGAVLALRDRPSPAPPDDASVESDAREQAARLWTRW
jgi:cytosine/adenosine deaminase-related metal-dependent hydrolase